MNRVAFFQSYKSKCRSVDTVISNLMSKCLVDHSVDSHNKNFNDSLEVKNQIKKLHKNVKSLYNSELSLKKDSQIITCQSLGCHGK